AGYAKVTVAPTRAAVDVNLRRQPIKAAYLTYYGFADRQIRGRVLDLVARTELNAIVVDVKGDRGFIPYRTEVPLALAAGAQGPVLLQDFEGTLADPPARGGDTIPRLVTFRASVPAHTR